MNGIRLDKWLWAARFFKTRALAAAACDAGRISCNAQPAKPSRNLKIDDFLQIRNDGGDFEVHVLALSDVRASASIAQTIYSETDLSRERRAIAAAERKLNPPPESTRRGKPSKRDRRLIHSFRGEF